MNQNTNEHTHPIAPVIGPTSPALDTNLPESLNEARKLLEQAIEIDETESNDSACLIDKLIIQIPCFNEAETLPLTLADLPRQLDGVRSVELLVIDDGSLDSTVAVAKENDVDHVLQLPKNQGLARAFMAGINEAVRLGADVIVNTDADNQYCGHDIEKLVEPILQGRADLVIGERPIMTTSHFSIAKKLLQKLGSWVVRKASTADVADAPSGFRAMTRQTAMRLNVFSDYTYTLETIIQAGQNNMAVVSVPIRTNPDLRPSRLLKSIPSYIRRSAATILRIFMTYRPLKFFGIPGIFCCSISAILCVRFLMFYMAGTGSGHVQSLILAAILMSAGLLSFVVGLIGDLISVNRKLLEKIDWRLRLLEERMSETSRIE